MTLKAWHFSASLWRPCSLSFWRTRLSHVRWSAILSLYRMMSCRYPRRIYRGLCNKLSAPVSERWQVQYTTQVASNCTHRGPIGMVNTVLGCSSGFCLYLVDYIRVVKSSQLPAKIAACLVSISQLLCLVIFFTDGVVEMKYPWTGR